MARQRKRGGKAGRPGKGLLDILKKGLAVAKTVSDITGIKPSALLANKGGPLGSIGSSLLASQGLGRKRKGGCYGQGRSGGLQYQSGVNNYPNSASIGLVRF